MPDQTAPGRQADAPGQIPAAGWWQILRRVFGKLMGDHVSVVSAGVAFFGLLAIFPGIGALLSIAGFLLDPRDVAQEIDAMASLLPENAAAIIQDQIVAVTGGDETATGLAAILGLLLALYGAMKGVKTLMEGMNIAYGEVEKRGFVRLNLIGFLLTLFVIAGVLVSLGAVMVLPVVREFIRPVWLGAVIPWLKWPILVLATAFGLSVLYRYGPSREDAKWRWITPGALVATVLWLLGTLGFSIYVQNFGSYNETYGTLGGVIILLTWLWLSSFIVLAGAELDAEMEHQTARDSTTGPARPMGQRGARVADTLPDDAAPGA